VEAILLQFGKKLIEIGTSDQCCKANCLLIFIVELVIRHGRCLGGGYKYDRSKMVVQFLNCVIFGYVAMQFGVGS
jgi:hypothetical protein